MASINLIILFSLLIATIFAFNRDKRQYEIFKNLSDSKDRQEFYKKWTIEPFVIYGVLSLIILALIGQLNSLQTMPNFLVSFVDSLELKSEIADSNIISGILTGITMSIVPVLIFGSIIGTYLREQQERKLKSQLKSDENDFRNMDALVPRNFKERLWGAILSINAGFSEELFFRVLAPILIYSVTDLAWIAIIGSTLWFALGHYYQGVAGLIITFFVGLLLFAVYLITQNIWITMIVHAVLDINGLVFSPWLKERYERLSL